MNSAEMIEKLKLINIDIKAKKLMPFYFLYGNEDYFVITLKNSIIRAFEDSTGLNVKKYNNENCNVKEVVKFVLQEPFMNDKKLIVFDNIDYFKVVKNEKNKEISELIEAFEKTKNINVVLYYKTEFDEKYNNYYIDNPFVSFFDKNGIALNLKKLDDDSLWHYVQNRFKKNNIEIDRVNIAYFIRNCNNDLVNLFNEADKLIAYIGDKKKVDKIDIDVITNRSLNDKIYTLIDLYNSNKIEEAIKYYGDLLTEGITNESIFSTFSYNYINLIICKDYMEKGKSLSEISKLMGIEVWRVRKFIEANKSVSIETLQAKIKKITEISVEKMKRNIDKDLTVLLLMN